MNSNYQFLVPYDGTDYCGFQRQSGKLRTIQGCLEKALSHICGGFTGVVGAGRTDAGVHARGQCVSFQAQMSVPVDRLPYAVNARLPDDIVVVAASQVEPSFCARRSARSKTYRYRIERGRFPCPLTKRYAWHKAGRLDIARMEDCARLLVGRHNFRAFSRAGSTAVTTVRNVLRLDIECADELTITIEADGFLYAMVRLIVGTLVAVGEGRLKPGDVVTALSSGKRGSVGATAPPQGLCLETVSY